MWYVFLRFSSNYKLTILLWGDWSYWCGLTIHAFLPLHELFVEIGNARIHLLSADMHKHQTFLIANLCSTLFVGNSCFPWFFLSLIAVRILNRISVQCILKSCFSTSYSILTMFGKDFNRVVEGIG